MTASETPITRPTPIPLYFCGGEECPGLVWRASDATHPGRCRSKAQREDDDWGFTAIRTDDNRPPPPSPLASILRIAEELRVMTDALEAAE